VLGIDSVSLKEQRGVFGVDEYRENGYLLLKSFFGGDEIDEVREEAKEIFTLQMRRLGIAGSEEVREEEFERGMFDLFDKDVATFANCGKQAQHLISLHRLSLDGRIVGKLQELGLEFPNISTRPVMYFNHERLAKKEVYWKLSAHQDWRSMQGSLDSMVVWIPLVDVDKDLGALEIIPGSHKWGLLEAEMADGYGQLEEEIEASEMVSVEVEKGDALFFSSFLAHQSGTNVTDHIRWSCHFRYNNLREETFVERSYPHPYLYQPQKDLITANFPPRELVEQAFG
jgi:ectoine hydroxylase-related dioxygenase (phytanoyl-CoA dioxygenase family)